MKTFLIILDFLKRLLDLVRPSTESPAPPPGETGPEPAPPEVPESPAPQPEPGGPLLPPKTVLDYVIPVVAAIEKMAGKPLTIEQKRALNLIMLECEKNGVSDFRQVAYILGTCWHECRLKPIKEIRAKEGSDVWKMQERYWHTGYYGRGYCQLTWKKNYQKFSPIVGIDLAANPDEVLKPEIGAKILVTGMKRGLFSGVGLDKYFNENVEDWLSARKIVNGTFQADKVAKAAKAVLAAFD